METILLRGRPREAPCVLRLEDLPSADALPLHPAIMPVTMVPEVEEVRRNWAAEITPEPQLPILVSILGGLHTRLLKAVQCGLRGHHHLFELRTQTFFAQPQDVLGNGLSLHRRHCQKNLNSSEDLPCLGGHRQHRQGTVDNFAIFKNNSTTFLYTYTKSVFFYLKKPPK